MFRDLEKLIIRKIRGIENASLTIETAKLGKWLNQMKEIDEPSYDKLLKRYMAAIPRKDAIRFAMA